MQNLQFMTYEREHRVLCGIADRVSVEIGPNFRYFSTEKPDREQGTAQNWSI